MNQKKTLIVIFIVFFLKTVVSFAQSENYIWDLSPLLPSEEAWEAEKTEIENKIIELKKYEGTLGKSAESLADALDAVYKLRARTGKMYMYGLLNYEVNVNSDKALKQYDVSTAFESKVESAVAFIRGEIKNIGEAKIKDWIKKEPRLEKHKIRLNRIIYESPYTLSNESQKVLESVLRWPRLSVDAYDKFYNSDLGWPVLNGIDGEEIVADPGAYNSAIRGAKNPDREKIIIHFLQKLKTLEDPFGILFTRRVEADFTIAKNRGFNGGMDAIWYLRDGMPVGSHKIAIEVSQSTLPTLNKYLKLRSQVLGVDKMSFPDLFTRTKLKKKFTIQETFDNYYNASKIFGTEYQKKLKERIKKPWMHLVDSDEKSGTYGIFPPVDDSPSYILMNYRETLASSRALAGAFGIMMAFEDIADVHPSDTRDDPGITSNAYIYVSNLLYYEYLKNKTNSVDEKIAYVLEELDLLATRMYFYPMLAEFETRIENLIINNNNPTGNNISKIYLETLKKYYGNNSDIMKIDDAFSYDWMTHGILFLSYEDQFWYAAAAAAASLYDGLLNKDEKVMKFFNNGYGVKEYDRSYPILLTAGIDMNSREPYQKLVERIQILCNELENLLKENSKSN